MTEKLWMAVGIAAVGVSVALLVVLVTIVTDEALGWVIFGMSLMGFLGGLAIIAEAFEVMR